VQSKQLILTSKAMLSSVRKNKRLKVTWKTMSALTRWHSIQKFTNREQITFILTCSRNILPAKFHQEATTQDAASHITTDEIPKMIMDASPTSTLGYSFMCLVCKWFQIFQHQGNSIWTVHSGFLMKGKHPVGKVNLPVHSECVSIHCGILQGRYY
jgi:hypothetical protein